MSQRPVIVPADAAPQSWSALKPRLSTPSCVTHFAILLIRLVRRGDFIPGDFIPYPKCALQPSHLHFWHGPQQ
ncbi:hypothetical protein AWB69_03642 [Caballeronia udeis]|uniref:Uncharacterized protein n=1 Tax=Caballeronia udeis TaxID=1232866 RepID=A0A158GZZ5_9BURK|nr:hypothetical protein AWB69_03642 [Caballeronia udeis]